MFNVNELIESSNTLDKLPAGEITSGEMVILALLKGRKLLWRKLDWDVSDREDVCVSMWSFQELLTMKTSSGDKVIFYLKP